MLEVVPPLYSFLLFFSASFDTFYNFCFLTFLYCLLLNFSFINFIDFLKYGGLWIWSKLSILEGHCFDQFSFDGCVLCAKTESNTFEMFY